MSKKENALGVNPRMIFTDGANSLWHFIFGYLSNYNKHIIPIFLFYQMIDITDKNMLVDITEFIIGNYSYRLFKKLNRYNQNKK